MGHSSPRCEQSIPSNSAIPKIPSPDLNLTGHQAAVAAVGEIYDGSVGAVAKTHSNPHFPVQSARLNNRPAHIETENQLGAWPHQFLTAEISVLYPMFFPERFGTNQGVSKVSGPALKVNRLKIRQMIEDRAIIWKQS